MALSNPVRRGAGHPDRRWCSRGIAGCHAAPNARRSGARVVVPRKQRRNGAATAAGVDHWLAACTNPSSEVSPEEFTAQAIRDSGGYDCGPLRYINAKTAGIPCWTVSRWGSRSDVHDEFKGAAFRDDDSWPRLRLPNKMDLRVYGWNMKPSLHKETKRLRVQILDCVMVTALLTEENDQGKRVVGAMGLHTRTGEFIIVQARRQFMPPGSRIWVFSTEHRPTFMTPIWRVMAWLPSEMPAEFTRSKRRIPTAARRSSPMAWARPQHLARCLIVDANARCPGWIETETVRSWQNGSGLPWTALHGHGQRIPPSYETMSNNWPRSAGAIRRVNSPCPTRICACQTPSGGPFSG